MTGDEYTRAYTDSLVAAGYLSVGEVHDPEVVAAVRLEVSELLDLAGAWPAGTIVERRLNTVRVRSQRGPASQAS